jgi:hypothetical protein
MKGSDMTKLQLDGTAETARSEPGLLSSKQQFWWGFAGGCLVLLFRLWVYANALAPDNAWPNASFRTCLLFAVWGAFPFASGLVSRICDPHHRFIAVFEGASGPALFFMVAKDFPL